MAKITSVKLLNTKVYPKRNVTREFYEVELSGLFGSIIRHITHGFNTDDPHDTNWVWSDTGGIVRSDHCQQLIFLEGAIK